MVLEDFRKETPTVTCNYIGHLELSKSNVAVTGCLEKSGDKMDITVLSEHSPNHHMFSVDFDGSMDVIENPFHNGGEEKCRR